MATVWFVDTNILCDLVEVPGKSDNRLSTRADLVVRSGRGDRFVIAVTAIIETGNHICNAKASGELKRRSATALDRLLRWAMGDELQWAILGATWDNLFIERLLEGCTTGQSFVELTGTSQLGAGDIAMLVEREQWKAATDTSGYEVGIWTAEQTLAAYS